MFHNNIMSGYKPPPGSPRSHGGPPTGTTTSHPTTAQGYTSNQHYWNPAQNYNKYPAGASSEITTDSNLTAVDFGRPQEVTDILPAVCTMDYIGCIIDGKWTVVDLEQADMTDEKNLFFKHGGRKYRVETCNIVLQYSRGYPSMTALNAAFNDNKDTGDEETQTINTEISEGLRAAGIDKFKIKMKDGKPTMLQNTKCDSDDDKTISEGEDALIEKTANLILTNKVHTTYNQQYEATPPKANSHLQSNSYNYNAQPSSPCNISNSQQPGNISNSQQQYQNTPHKASRPQHGYSTQKTVVNIPLSFARSFAQNSAPQYSQPRQLSQQQQYQQEQEQARRQQFQLQQYQNEQNRQHMQEQERLKQESEKRRLQEIEQQKLKAREEQERQEKIELRRQEEERNRKEAERLQKLEAERRRRIELERLQMLEAERFYRQEKEKLQRLEAERLQKLEAERLERQERQKAEDGRVIAEEKRRMKEYVRNQERIMKERESLLKKEHRLQEYLKNQAIQLQRHNQQQQNTIVFPPNMAQYLQTQRQTTQQDVYNTGFADKLNYKKPCSYQVQQNFGGFGQFQPYPFQATVGFCAAEPEAETAIPGIVEDTDLQKPEYEKGTTTEEKKKAVVPTCTTSNTTCTTSKTKAVEVEEKRLSCQTYEGTYKVKIDGEWYTVPGQKITNINNQFCSVIFSGQNINIERSALIECEEENITGGVIESAFYEVFANKRWNKVKCTAISPSKKQPGTFIVRLNDRSIRLSPVSIRPVQDKRPFRSSRTGVCGTSPGHSRSTNGGAAARGAQSKDKTRNSRSYNSNIGATRTRRRRFEHSKPAGAGYTAGAIQTQDQQSAIANKHRIQRSHIIKDVVASRKRHGKSPRTPTVPVQKATRAKAGTTRAKAGARRCYFGQGLLPQIQQVKSKRIWH